MTEQIDEGANPPLDSVETTHEISKRCVEIRDQAVKEAEHDNGLLAELEKLEPHMKTPTNKFMVMMIKGTVQRNIQLSIWIADLSHQMLKLSTASLTKGEDTDSIRRELESYAEPMRLLREMNKENEKAQEIHDGLWKDLIKRKVFI